MCPASSGARRSATNFFWKSPAGLPNAGEVQESTAARSRPVSAAAASAPACRPSSGRPARACRGRTAPAWTRRPRRAPRSSSPRPARARRSPAGRARPAGSPRPRSSRSAARSRAPPPPMPCRKMTGITADSSARWSAFHRRRPVLCSPMTCTHHFVLIRPGKPDPGRAGAVQDIWPNRVNLSNPCLRVWPCCSKNANRQVVSSARQAALGRKRSRSWARRRRRRTSDSVPSPRFLAGTRTDKPRRSHSLTADSLPALPRAAQSAVRQADWAALTVGILVHEPNSFSQTAPVPWDFHIR